jgi:fumarylacetoacetate (FAA) hydrolase
MKIVTYKSTGSVKNLGLLIDNKIYNVHQQNKTIPNSMLEFLNMEEKGMELMREAEFAIKNGKAQSESINYTDDILLAPIPNPTSCRDGYAFRQHVASARRNRGVPMIPEFDQYPIMYFTNHNAIQGPGEILCMPDHFNKLDFELEASVVLGKKGRNIKAEHADQYIAGYMIMNDMSARALQMEEMVLNLGPAKGKDFSTVIGPYMVTPDELEQFKTNPKANHVGNSFALDMKCWVNGVLVSHGNMGDMDWTFAEIIERCAYGVDVYPGDVIGSGTVGTGCFLELNGTGLLNDKNYQVQWLKDQDVVEMEIEGLGRLKNTIKADQSQFSILELKKKTAVS